MHRIFLRDILTWNGRYFKESVWKEFFRLSWLSLVDMAGTYILLLQKGNFNLLLFFNHLIIQVRTDINWISQFPPGNNVDLDRVETVFMGYGSIARRHGHVFRMALHNEEDWRMETWQRARRASCHVSIRQSPSCVMPFWTHAKCLLAFISYLPMWIKAKYTFIKTVYSPRFYGGPY